jgi:PAS domain S-box-containing protein
MNPFVAEYWRRRPSRHRGWACFTGVLLALAMAFTASQVAAAGRTVRVGVYQNKPKIFMDESGQAAGIYIDLLTEMAVEEQWTLVYVPCQWADCLAALDAGQIDLMPDVAYTAERAEKYDFHPTPVLTSWSQVYANSHLRVNGFNDLAGRKVAILQGSIQQTVFQQYMSGFGLEVTLVPTDSLEAAFQMAANGTADAAIANNFFGDYFYQTYGLEKTPIVFNPATLFYATAKGHNADLLEAIERHLTTWLQASNSPYYAALSRWTEKPPAPVYQVPPYVYWVIGLTGGLLVVALGMIWLLRTQVAARTKHLEQANEALRESQTRYQLISTVASDYMFSSRLTADGRLTTNWVAGAFEAITGYTLEEFVAHGGWRATLHPDDFAQDDRDLEKLCANQPVITEIRTLTKAGRLVWVRVYAHPVLDAERQQLVGIYGAVQDITERRQMEQALRESEAKFSKAFRANPDSVVISRLADGRYIDVNESFVRAIGYAREEIIGHTSTELNLWEPAERGRFQTELEQHGTLHDFEAVLRKKSGERVFALIAAETIPLGPELCLIATLRDVTLQKQAEAALRESEARYRHLFEQNPAPMLIYDRETLQLLAANDAFIRDYGYDSTEALALRLTDLYPAEEKSAITELAAHLHGYKNVGEWHHLKKDGTRITIVASSHDLPYKGRVARVAVITDVTERKRNEEEILRLSRLYAVLSQVNLALVHAEARESLFQCVCQVAVEDGGLKLAWVGWLDAETQAVTVAAWAGEPEEYIQRLNVYADDRPEGRGPTGTAIREGQRYVYNDYLADPVTLPWREAATRAGLRASAVFPFRCGGTVCGALTLYAGETGFFADKETELLEEIALDLSYGLDHLEEEARRQRAEEVLAANEKRLSLIFDAVSDVIFLLSVEPDDDFRFASVNPAFLALTGLKYDQVVGKRINEVLPEAAQALVTAKYRQAIRENKTVIWEEVSAYPTGTLDGIVAVSPAWNAAGVCTHLIGSVHDVTEIRRAEEEIRTLNQELEQRVADRTVELSARTAEIQQLNAELAARAQKLEAANHELEAFSYSVSHDLKAPLRGIDGYSRLLQEDYADRFDEDGRLFVQTIRAATAQMSELIDDLLAYSRLERRALSAALIDLPPFVTDLLATYADDFQGRQVALRVTVPPVTVRADFDGLAMALRNLVDNALKFTRGGAIPAIEIGGQTTDTACILWVRDNGIGFDMQYHDRIFEIFQRLQRAEDYPGTGVGLALVRKAMQRMGGRVWAESQPGQGATFYLEVPR